MKFKSSLVTQISGSVGGLTGSHNQGGMYFRARSIPVNPNTVQQQAVRNFLSQCATAWLGTLTAAQRAAWETYAANVPLVDALGEPRHTTGIAHYIRSNVPRLQAGLPRVDAGPTIFALPTFNTLSFSVDAANDEIDVVFDDTEAWVDEDDCGLLIYCSRPQGATINYWKGPYRYADMIEGNSVTPETSPYAAALPFPAEVGHVVHAKCLLSRADGRLSSPFRGPGVGA